MERVAAVLSNDSGQKGLQAGLFHCYDFDGLPRTNNALEQLFGSSRYHERRACGRRRGGASRVVRGQVRIVAAAATRLAPVQGPELAPKEMAT